MGLTFAFGRGGTRPPSVTPDIEAPSAPTGLTASIVTQTTYSYMVGFYRQCRSCWV